MNHLDEGTIHAWIDGALDATQSREIEAHLAQCAACSAAVAEARGFVAATSRILMALDDVPAGVVPKRTVAPRPRRQWRAASWVTGIAAALMLAVVLTLPGTRGAMKVEQVANQAIVTDSARPMESAIASTAAGVGNAGGAGVVSAADRQQRSLAPAAPSVGAVASKRAARDAQERVAEGQRREGFSAQAENAPVKSAEVAQAPLSAAPAPSAPARDERSLGDDATRMRKAAALSPPVSALSVTAVDAATKSDLAGCYRIDATALRRTLPSAAAALGKAAARGASSPAASPAEARADYYTTDRAAMLVRLDTTASPLGFRVKSVVTDSSIGSWREIAGDSARVDLLARGVFAFAKRDRVACP